MLWISGLTFFAKLKIRTIDPLVNHFYKSDISRWCTSFLQRHRVDVQVRMKWLEDNKINNEITVFFVFFFPLLNNLLRDIISDWIITLNNFNISLIIMTLKKFYSIHWYANWLFNKFLLVMFINISALLSRWFSIYKLSLNWS